MRCGRRAARVELTLTGVAEVEVVLDVAGDVILPPELLPVGVGLLVVADEDPEQDDHGDLPHEADGRQGHPHIGALGATVEPAQHGGGGQHRQ